MSKYWEEIEKYLKKLKENKAVNDINRKQISLKEAIIELKKIFGEFIQSTPQITQSNFHQVVEENTIPRQKSEDEKAIVLEWGNKIRLTEKERNLLEKKHKNSLLNLFQGKNIPEKIIRSDYYYICFHIDNHDISFPHNKELTSIPLDVFIENPKAILPKLKYCLSSPQRNNKILKKGIDY